MDRSVARAISHVCNATEDFVGRCIFVTMDDMERKKGIRRTTLIMVAIALSFFFGFILLGVIRS